MKNADSKPAAALPLPELIAVAQIRPDPKNRKDHDKVKLASLAASIKDDGLLQPIVLRRSVDVETKTDFIIIAGERRWLAHKLNKSETILARVLPEAVGEIAHHYARKDIRLRGVENLQRENLTVLEEAAIYQEMVDAGDTQAEIAEAVGKSQPEIANTLAMLRLPPEVGILINTGKLNSAHGKALVKFAPWPEVCRLIAKFVVENEWTSKDLEGRIHYNLGHAIANAKLGHELRKFDFPNYVIPPVVKNDPDVLEIKDEFWCFNWKRYQEIMAPIVAANKAEQARVAASHKTAKETDKGALVEKRDEYLTALLKPDQIGKRTGKLVALDSTLWNNILRTRSAYLDDVAERRCVKLAKKALEALKKTKKPSPAMVGLLFHDGDTEFYTPDYSDAEKMAKLLGVKTPWFEKGDINPKTVGTADPMDMLRLQIAYRLNAIIQPDGFIECLEIVDLVAAAAGEKSAGMPEETEAGRQSVIAHLRKELKIPDPSFDPKNKVTTAKSAAQKARTAK